MFDRKKWRDALSELDQAEAFRARACIYLMIFLSGLYLIVLPIRHYIEPLGSIQMLVVGFCVILNLVSGLFIFFMPAKLVGRILFLVGIFLIMIGAAYLNDGLGAPIVTLAMLFPIVASFLIGRNAAVIFTAMSVLLIVASFTAKSSGLLPPPRLNTPETLDQARVLIFSAVTLFSLAVGFFYETFRLKVRTMERRIAELDTVQAMIATYNHEINNPLMIAMTGLQMMRERNEYPPEQVEKLSKALVRIANVVKKIRDIPSNGDLETGEYVGGTKIVKVS